MGPPGGGKTMLARRLTTILPPLAGNEVLEVATIWSVAGLLVPPAGRVRTCPFRAPHHTVSVAGLIGGGVPSRQGEVTLAHLGVLSSTSCQGARRHLVEDRMDGRTRPCKRGQAMSQGVHVDSGKLEARIQACSDEAS